MTPTPVGTVCRTMRIDAALALAVADEMARQSLSTPRLAARSNLPRSTLYDLLSGRQAWKAEQAWAVARGLGITFGDLSARAEDLMG